MRHDAAIDCWATSRARAGRIGSTVIRQTFKLED